MYASPAVACLGTGAWGMRVVTVREEGMPEGSGSEPFFRIDGDGRVEWQEGGNEGSREIVALASLHYSRLPADKKAVFERFQCRQRERLWAPGGVLCQRRFSELLELIKETREVWGNSGN
ncbi:MAG: hypothetical protein ACYCOU_07315 [Sulfobacillus sp.]